MEDLGAGAHCRRVRGVDVVVSLDREREVMQPRRIQLERLLLERLAQAEGPGAHSREAEVVDLLAALAFDEVRRLEPERTEDGCVEGERALQVAADEVDVAEADDHSSASASSVATSATRIVSPVSRTPSSSMTVQNGHATASVSAPVSTASRARSPLIGLPVSSIHMCAPPAPQQNVCLPLRFISIGLPTASTSLRGWIK